MSGKANQPSSLAAVPAANQPPRRLANRDAALDRWCRQVPPRVRETLLGPDRLEQLLARCERFLRDGCPEVLETLGQDVYQVAYLLEPLLGPDGTLRLLRDFLARALAQHVHHHPEDAMAAGRVLCRVSDAVWSAHAERLGQTIRTQQENQLHQELMLAKRIQERLLPRTVPQVPGYDIAGRVLAAAEVGGDYWSCRDYPEDGIVTLKLADVTGHGVAAATLVAAVKFISGGYYRGSKTAAQVMDRTNHVLNRDTPHEVLVTMVYGWLHHRSHELTVVNAGHSPVLHYHAGQFRSIAPTGPALGMMETRYSEVRLSLALGDLFVASSDGITAPTSEGALGEDWLRDQLHQGAELPSAELVDRVVERALEHYGTPSDDMSLLIVKRTK